MKHKLVFVGILIDWVGHHHDLILALKEYMASAINDETS